MRAQRAEEFSDFSVTEWMRLDAISSRYDRALKVAYTQTVVQNNPNNEAIVKDVIQDAVAETGVGTAHVYGMTFDPTASAYQDLVGNLTDGFMKVVRNEEAREKVKAILPNDISLADRSNRLSVFGLSSNEAVRLERLRQQGVDRQTLSDTRLHMSLRRGNLVALTEINRVINATLETVWLENMQISKARRDPKPQILQESGGKVRSITSLRGLPSRARKVIVTRRDNRVCEYCDPLEGVRGRIGMRFRTRYGVFSYPPFHPRCRCFMIVRF